MIYIMTNTTFNNIITARIVDIQYKVAFLGCIFFPTKSGLYRMVWFTKCFFEQAV